MKKRNIRKQMQKVSKVLLALFVVVTTFVSLPETKNEVNAATGSKKGLMLAETGLANIRNASYYDGDLDNEWQGDYLYWGNDSSVKWQILNKNATEFGSNGGMLILSGNLGNTKVSSDVYEGSTLDSYLSTQFNTRLTTGEKNATLDSSNTDTSEYTGPSGHAGADQVFSNKKFFAPTAKMMLNTAYGFSSTPANQDKARLTNMNDRYWLSARTTNFSENAGAVQNDGLLYTIYRYASYPSRGASKINAKSLLFVSAANGGKSRVVGSVLAPVNASASNEWKFTLKDSGQSITNHTVKRTALDKVEITLDKVGQGTSISAVVTDASGTNIMNYGRVGSVATGTVNNQKVEITLPEDVINETNKLYIFTEQYNGETASDYASALVEVDITPAGLYKYKDANGVDATKVALYDFGDPYVPFADQPKFYKDTKGDSYLFDKWQYDPIDYVDVDGKVQKSYTATAQYLKFTPADILLFNTSTKAYLNPKAYATNKEWDNNYLDWAGSKWRILNTSESNYGGTGVLLQGESSLGNSAFGSNATYTGSTLESKIDSKATSTLSTQEKAATINTTSSGSYTIGSNTYLDGITNKLWFAPSVKMMTTPTYGYSVDELANLSRKMSNESWLSSATSGNAGSLKVDGSIGSDSATNSKDTFVGTQLKPDSVLMLSAGAKQTNAIGKDALKTVGNSNAKEWKVTLKDDTQSLVVASATTNIDNLATIKYTNTGVGTTLSAVVMDESGENVLSYGQVAKLSESSEKTVQVQLPADFYTKKYKLKLFSEVYHSDTTTDYGSAFVDTNVAPNVVGDITIKYRDASYVEQTKTYTNVIEGTKLNDDTDFKNIKDLVPTGYRQNKPLWTFSDSANANEFDYATKAFTASANYTKVYDVTFKYRKKDHSEITNEKITVDTGTNLETTSKLPTLPATYDEISKVTYRFNETGNHWKVTGGTGSISDVTSDLVVEAPTTKQYETLVTYRDETDPKTFVENKYWIDENTSVLDKLPTLQKQIKGYRLKENKTDDKNIIWKSDGVTNTLSSIKEASTIQPEYVKNWEVSFKTWDDKTWVDSPWKDGPVFVDDKTSLSAAQIPTNIPDRLFYKFTKWNTDTSVNITDDTTIKPEYRKQNIEIHSAKNKDAQSSADAKTLFVGDHDAINAALKKIFVPELYSDGAKDPVQDGISIKLKNSSDYAKLKAGTIKTYVVSLDYLNPKDNTYQLQRDVELKVNKNVVEESVNHGKIAANDFSLSILEVDDTTKYVSYAGAYAYDKSETSQTVTLSSGKLNKATGVYPVTFKAMLDGVETSITVNATIKDASSEKEVSPGVTERISGNDFRIQKSDVASIKGDNDALIALGKVEAYIAETGEEITTIHVSGNDKIEAKRGVYEITFKTENDTAIVVNVQVLDEGKEGTDYRVYANDFSVSMAEASAITNDRVIELANAKAIHKTTGAYEIPSVDKTKLKAVRGSYEITFSASDHTTLTVKANVSDKSETNGDEYITANDFAIKLSEYASFNAEKAKTLSDVKAVNMKSGSDVDVSSVDISNVKEKEGTYPVVFKTDAGTSISVQVMIEKNQVVNDKDKEVMYSNDFTISEGMAANLLSDADLNAKLIVYGQARAYVKDTTLPIVVEVKSHTLQAKQGKYEVVYQSETGKTQIVSNVIVTKTGSEDIVKHERIAANDIMMSTSDVSKFNTDKKLIELAKAEAMDTNTGAFLDIIVDSKIVAKKGSYDVSFATHNGTSVTIQANVMDNGASNPDTNEAIYANHFTLKKSDVESLDDAKVKRMAQAKAFSTIDGSEVPITKVDYSTIQAKEGTYKVTFETAKGTSVTSKATIQKNSVVGDSEEMYSNDFTMSVKQVEALLQDSDMNTKLITYGQVKGFIKDTTLPIDVEVKSHTLQAKQGVYEVTYQSETGKTMIVSKVIVTEKGSEDPSLNERIVANDIVMKIDDVKDLNDAKIIALAKAEAMNTSTGDFLDIRVTSKIKASQGVYDVIFATEKGTSVTIRAHVLDTGVISPDAKEAVYANNFTIQAREVASMTSDKIIEKSQAKGIDLYSGAQIKVSAIGSIKAIAATYPVTISTPNKTSVEIRVTVIAEPQVNKPVTAIGQGKGGFKIDGGKNTLNDKKPTKDKKKSTTNKKKAVNSKTDSLMMKKKNNEIWEDSLLPLWMLLYMCGYVWFVSRKEDGE